MEVFVAGVANEDIFNKTYAYGLEHYAWAVELLVNEAATTILFNVMCYIKYHHWIWSVELILSSTVRACLTTLIRKCAPVC